MLRAVAFDLDSTLTDFLHFKRMASDSAALAMVDAGLDLDVRLAQERLWDTYRDHGLDEDVAFEAFLHHTVGKVEPRLLASALHAYLRTKDLHLQPYPRTVETLLGLARRGLELAVITDARRAKALQRLEAMRLTPFFDPIITGDDTFRGKEDETPYRMLLRRLGMEPQEVLMVGDNPARDVRPARAVGLHTALAAYGAQPHFATGFPQDRAHHVLHRIDDLLPVVDRIGTPRAPREAPPPRVPTGPGPPGAPGDVSGPLNA